MANGALIYITVIWLQKEPPKCASVAIGPNVMLHPMAPLPPRPITILPPAKPFPYRPPAVMFSPTSEESATPALPTVPVFQPTIPAGPIPSAQLIVDMVNASAKVLTTPVYEQCWICYSAQPFYERITTSGTLTISLLKEPSQHSKQGPWQDFSWSLSLLSHPFSSGLCPLCLHE